MGRMPRGSKILYAICPRSTQKGILGIKDEEQHCEKKSERKLCIEASGLHCATDSQSGRNYHSPLTLLVLQTISHVCVYAYADCSFLC